MDWWFCAAPVGGGRSYERVGLRYGEPGAGHLRTVTPRLVVSDGVAAIAFYAGAFGAGRSGTGSPGRTASWSTPRSGSVIRGHDHRNAVDGPVSSPQRLGGKVTCVLSMYWADVDAAWERAVAAGAEVMYPLEDQFYGERGGRLRDPFGQQWMMSQHIEDVPAGEMARRAAAFFSGR